MNALAKKTRGPRHQVTLTIPLLNPRRLRRRTPLPLPLHTTDRTLRRLRRHSTSLRPPTPRREETEQTTGASTDARRAQRTVWRGRCGAAAVGRGQVEGLLLLLGAALGLVFGGAGFDVGRGEGVDCVHFCGLC